MTKLFKKFLKMIQEYFTVSRVLQFLEEKAVRFALKKLLGSAVAGGVYGWFITFFIKEILFDKAIEPLVRAALIEIGYGYDVIKGHILIRKLNKAEDDNDQDAYNDIVDDILG